jgi:hypothetical protein
LQQLRDAKQRGRVQAEEQEALFADQLSAKDRSAAEYQHKTDATLAQMQMQMQSVMAASVSKVAELKAELAAVRGTQ